jgi:hypothetical protein
MDDLGCTELKAMRNFTGMSGPFVECSLSPADPVAGIQKQRTSFQPNTASPKWVSSIRVVVEDKLSTQVHMLRL